MLFWSDFSWRTRSLTIRLYSVQRQQCFIYMTKLQHRRDVDHAQALSGRMWLHQKRPDNGPAHHRSPCKSPTRPSNRGHRPGQRRVGMGFVMSIEGVKVVFGDVAAMSPFLRRFWPGSGPSISSLRPNQRFNVGKLSPCKTGHV
jgi:hypothetical protein